MKSRKLQVRVDEESYDLMVSLLEKDETVSDYIRRSMKLQSALRLLGKDD